MGDSEAGQEEVQTAAERQEGPERPLAKQVAALWVGRLSVYQEGLGPKAVAPQVAFASGGVAVDLGVLPQNRSPWEHCPHLRG